MVAFDAHDARGSDAQVGCAEMAHANEIRGDERVLERDENVQSGLCVLKHVLWIEE